MSDAYGSWPWDGMLEGGSKSLGSYYSCLEASPPPAQGEEEEPFHGKYCMVYHFVLPDFLVPPDDIKMKMGDPNSPLQPPKTRGVINPLEPPFSELFSDPTSLAQVKNIFLYYYYVIKLTLFLADVSGCEPLGHVRSQLLFQG